MKMTSLTAIVVALALIVNDVNFILKGTLQETRYLGAALVFLLSVAILVGQLNIFPTGFWRRHSTLCLLLEVPFVVLILECSMRFFWHIFQEFVSSHAEAALSHLAEDRGLDGFICYLCCGKKDCARIFAGAVLKMFSFGLLLATFGVAKVK